MDRTDANFDRILTKLTQIQELIDRGATAGEVAAATGRMQALLSRHNLTIELVAMHKGEQRHAPTEFTLNATSATWIRTLANGLARANYGRAIIGQHGEIHIVCHADDWHTITYLFEKFRPLVEKLAPVQYEMYVASQHAAFYERYGNDTYGRAPWIQSKRIWCTDWRNGCAQGIAHALQQARRDAEADTDGSNALVVVKEDAVNEAFQELHPRTQTMSTRIRNSAAYTSGYQTGASLGRGTSVASGN